MSVPPNLFGSSSKPAEGKPDDSNVGTARPFGGFGFPNVSSNAGSMTPAGNPSTSTAGNGFGSSAFGSSDLFGTRSAGGEQTKPSSLFGGGTSGSANIFGTTPTGSSTTAGQTPAPTSGANAPNAFGATQAATTETGKSSIFGGGGNIFGTASNNQPNGNQNSKLAPVTASQPTSSSMFSGFPKPTQGTGLFGAAPKPTETGNTPASTSTPQPHQVTSNLFGNATVNSLSSFTSTSNPTTTFAPPSDAPTPAFGTSSNLFGGSTQAQTGSGATAAPSFGLFGKPSEPSKPADGSASKSSNLFGTVPTPTTNTGDPEKKTAPAPTVNLFGTKPATVEKKDSSSTTAAPGAGATNVFTGFASATKPAESPNEKEKDKDKPAPTPTKEYNTSGGLFGALPKKPEEKDSAETSTAGAAPALAATATPPSQMRGKSIEEIVTRWEQDLQTNLKEFNRIAEEVSAWDKVLIGNGNYIAQLHNQVMAAEASQQLIEQTLSSVESQQQELGATLEVYEKQAKEILEGSGGALRALETGPADAARDRNYALAAELSVNFDDLTKSLSQMIESVNELSITSGNEASDKSDPLTQIAEVLNEHLASLTWIDGAIGDMETKLSQVKPRLGGLNTPRSNGSSMRRAPSGYRPI